MSAPVHTVSPTDSLWQTWALMSRSEIRHAVVVDRDSTVLGVVDDRHIVYA